MTKFRVWVRLLGPQYRVRVDGVHNAHWLLNRLTKSSMVPFGEPLVERAGSPICNFFVPCTPTMPPAQFESLLAAIPEVRLMIDPE